ncbi:hypothetical protein IAI58_19280 (plasmid) [Roseomonas marmotae]|uniref:hypothetical protein n=1 Tax=Roseomonas marmotae TaxID=2768161 RepID=UPI001AD7D3DE|nr:hypothetical protein [Roseomonas marmotae]QTI81486.1 hypothetical protein IAI58_19280 [Roseomonas marmotae]
MANTIRIKRRASTGAAGAPASLANAELAFNERDNILYYGWGTGGEGGTATQVIPIGGHGFAFAISDIPLTPISAFAAPNQAVDFAGQRLTGLGAPVAAGDAATKRYVDSAVQGLRPKEAARAGTTEALNALAGLQTIDGVTLAEGDRVLVMHQAVASQNGIYIASASAWERTEDADTWDDLVSAFIFVEEGTQNGDNGYLCSIDKGGTLGTDAVTFVQFSGAGQIDAGDGLAKTGNRLDIQVGTGIEIKNDGVGLSGQAYFLHTLASNGFVVRLEQNGQGRFAARMITKSGNGISVACGNGIDGNPTISLASALQAIGALTAAADRIAYFTAGDAAALATLTAYGRSLIAAADAAAARTVLGLGTMAVQNANNVDITGGTIAGTTIDCGEF